MACKRAAPTAGQTDRTVEAMAACYIEAMRTVQPRGPYRIGGYCYGGVVAYEMARQLEVMGERVALVAIIEGFAPKRFQTWRSPLDPRRLQIIWRSMPYWAADYAKLYRGWLIQFARSRVEARLRARSRVHG